jgi:hypothetical protein
MTVHNHLGFLLKNLAVTGSVLIPKYYNPEIKAHLDSLRHTHELMLFGELFRRGHIQSTTGDEIGKMAYDTGLIPFIRTSDISNWEIKTDPKQGVSEAIYDKYASKQDVQPGDLLFVRDGTYLIGATCLLTEADSKILYQSHILKFRVAADALVSSPLILALLSAPIVRKQIRAKQFTADIIDTIGNRYHELILPLPKHFEIRSNIEKAVLAVVHDRVALRERLRRIPLWSQGLIPSLLSELPDIDSDQLERVGNSGFIIQYGKIRSNVFIPRYYDPVVDEELRGIAITHEIISISDLVKKGILTFDTGIEVGKMAYGTGPIPFIRTSDLSNWELKADPKQNVSEDLYDHFKNKLDVRSEDLFVVRDGTYLVGTSCILTEHDTRILYCGGLYKIRVKKKDELDPYLLLAILNCPIVKRQMRDKQFTRDVIDTLGKRIFEVILPIPKDKGLRERIARETRETVLARVDLRDKAKQISLDVEGITEPGEEDKEFLEAI